MKIVRNLLIVLLLLSALTFGTLIRSRSLDKSFAKIKPGDTRQQVAALRGSPRYVRPCGPVLDIPGCAEEMVYAHPFAPMVPEYWLVALGADGRVLQTAHTTTY